MSQSNVDSLSSSQPSLCRVLRRALVSKAVEDRRYSHLFHSQELRYRCECRLLCTPGSLSISAVLCGEKITQVICEFHSYTRVPHSTPHSHAVLAPGTMSSGHWVVGLPVSSKRNLGSSFAPRLDKTLPGVSPPLVLQTSAYSAGSSVFVCCVYAPP